MGEIGHFRQTLDVEEKLDVSKEQSVFKKNMYKNLVWTHCILARNKDFVYPESQISQKISAKFNI